MFINQTYIEGLLAAAKAAPSADIDSILDRAERMEGLKHQDIAALLMCEDEGRLARIFDIAGKIKAHIYGNRIVMFAPLYVSDHCVNSCAYCSYNCRHQFNRKKLTMDEVREEVRLLEKMGHKRIALEAGEHDGLCPMDYILECMRTIYDMKFENGAIRRINVNIAATTVENYRALKEAEIGTYILFQETYHRPAYEKVHPTGPKGNYEYHLTAFDRAMEGGIDDVGAGVLFGLADPYFEVLGLMLHNEHLEERFGVGFHTISVPRLCKAEGMSLTDFPNLVDDRTFEKIVAIIRLAVPFTGMILSTREDDAMRQKLLKIGISQLSAGSSTEVGGYALREAHGDTGSSQFEVSDHRSALDIIRALLDEGYIPSFCTACYRSGRTGDRFMSLAKSGQIKNVCLPNALMTLCEYAADYGDDAFKASAHAAVQRMLPAIVSDKVRAKTEACIAQIQADGRRDFYL